MRKLESLCFLCNKKLQAKPGGGYYFVEYKLDDRSLRVHKSCLERIIIMKAKYFLSVTFAGELIKREVTLEEYCKAERAAGFRPKMASDDPRYMITPATGGFGTANISGRVEYSKED